MTFFNPVKSPRALDYIADMYHISAGLPDNLSDICTAKECSLDHYENLFTFSM